MKSGVFVPLMAGGEVGGFVSLQNVDREHAFSGRRRAPAGYAGQQHGRGARRRACSTDQRLLKETEQRNAELAVINSIQQGMAGSLDFQGHRRSGG